MTQTASWVEPTGEEEAAGLHKYNRSDSPYERYMDEQGIPIIRGIGVYDTRDVELGEEKAGNPYGIHEGGRTILYWQKDPHIRSYYAEQLAKHVVQCDMKESLYKQPEGVVWP
jgi:hypothetical protein